MIRFDFITMSWEGLTEEQLDLWCALYPDVDVPNELRFNIVRWLDRQKDGDKVNKKARKKNWKRFITGWLSRAQARSIGI